MLIYHIRLPKKQDAKAFATFMREEYFPAVHKGPTRVGQVLGLLLLARENEVTSNDVAHEFIWQVDWSGISIENVRVDDAVVARKLEAFEPDIRRLGSYNKAAAWHWHEEAGTKTAAED
ncbi:hypothetical protein [Hymenobacter sp. GOD-10R]|uniref:hypothetical protein n=1 Tax=Hymenobacter sp. GOD-10R TaxID=3093922 RepID=UPI002D775536|nr:hypothetical protein [Hymenobacter sp. GOD-10R]WRQ27682.1 hypothetical protein SD425_21665 [Hymenobacter sp. GOD-10R]